MQQQDESSSYSIFLLLLQADVGELRSERVYLRTMTYVLENKNIKNNFLIHKLTEYIAEYKLRFDS